MVSLGSMSDLLPLPPEEIRFVGRGDFEKVGELVFRQLVDFSME